MDLITIQVKDGGTVESLREARGCTVGSLRGKVGACSDAQAQVNNVNALDSQVLLDGDILVFVPPHKDKGC